MVQNIFWYLSLIRMIRRHDGPNDSLPPSRRYEYECYRSGHCRLTAYRERRSLVYASIFNKLSWHGWQWFDKFRHDSTTFAVGRSIVVRRIAKSQYCFENIVSEHVESLSHRLQWLACRHMISHTGHDISWFSRLHNHFHYRRREALLQASFTNFIGKR